jgi:hypothetical protein
MIMHHLNVMQPAVVHFSGHGSSAVAVVRDRPSQREDGRRDAAAIGNAGIVLHDNDGEPRHVTASALTRMIGSAAPSTRLVVLNACYSQEVARSLCSVVDCAIGMHGSLADPAARAFAVALYRALGYCRSVDNALAQAAATLEAHGFAAHCAPVCHTPQGDQCRSSRLAPALSFRDSAGSGSGSRVARARVVHGAGRDRGANGQGCGHSGCSRFCGSPTWGCSCWIGLRAQDWMKWLATQSPAVWRRVSGRPACAPAAIDAGGLQKIWPYSTLVS